MKKFSIILGAIILVLFVTLVIWGVYCDNTIAITNYCVNNTKNDAKLKFVVITDLHPHTAVSATMSVTMPPNSERILKAKQIQQALYCSIMNI